jgi:predicted membrane protein
MTAKRVLVSIAVVLASVGMYPVVSTQPGAHAAAVTQGFLTYYSGVFSLIAFTGAVVWGLLAAERMMPVRHRVLSQGIHRAFGLLGLGFLVTHIVMQILAENSQPVDAVVPFLDTDGRLVATGLGTIAADLMLVVYVVGKLRARFVNAARPWVWRIVHGMAYLSWPIAITHGLSAGRQVKGTWVTVSYTMCLCMVVIALLIRLLSPFPAMRSARPEPADFADERPQPPARGRGDRRRPPAPDRTRRGAGTRPTRPQERVRPLGDTQPREAVPPPRPSVPLREAASRRGPRPPYEGPQGPGRTTGPIERTTGPIERTTGPIERTTGPMEWTTGPMERTPYEPPRPAEYVPPVVPVSPVLPVGPGMPMAPAAPGADPRSREPRRPAASAPPRAPEAQRERLLIPDRPDGARRPGAERPASSRDQRDQRDKARQDEDRQPRHWLDAVERFPLFQWRSRSKTGAARPIVNPDIDEVEFWATLRAETSVWIRRGRR